MSYHIRYNDKNGQPKTHVYSGSEAGAKAWAEGLSRDNGGRKATAVQVPGGPYGPPNERHIITVGDDD